MKITVYALIYRSIPFLESLWSTVQATVPDDVEFFFLANNASEQVLAYLEQENIPHHIRNEQLLTEAERKAKGIDTKLDYISDVYRGWNEGIRRATGDVVIPVNSDHIFSSGWLGELLADWTPARALSPVMIERKRPNFNAKVGGGTGSLVHDCGDHPQTFDPDKFQRAIDQHIRPGRVTPGGVFMPCAISRQVCLDIGLYPEGNLAKRNWPVGYPGDRDFFNRLCLAGVKHETIWSSFCYHFMEGEMRE